MRARVKTLSRFFGPCRVGVSPTARLKHLLLLGFLAGCTTMPVNTPSGVGVGRSNTAIAQDFADLVFETESGVRIPVLLRYEGPIRVSLSPAFAAYRGNLQETLGNIRRGAGIDITMAQGRAQINILQVPAAEMHRAFPTAACFVAPGVSSWAEYRRNGSPRWSQQRHLDRAAVFIPDNAAPYVVRACLNEEIAQALGPVNDLYRVANTVFNDDNVHNTLTAFDLLILRVLYDPALSNGMNRSQTMAKVGAILRAANPSGIGGNGNAARDSRAWETQIETAMNSNNPRASRQRAAVNAIAAARPLGDHRLVHSLLIFGRLHLQNNPEKAAPAFQEAYTLAMQTLGPNDLRTALTAMHIAAVALSAERFEDALTFATPAVAVAKAQNSAVIASGLQGIRALALTRLGRTAQAETAHRDSLALARLAFGENAARIATAQAELAGLIPGGN